MNDYKKVVEFLFEQYPSYQKKDLMPTNQILVIFMEFVKL